MTYFFLNAELGRRGEIRLRDEEVGKNHSGTGHPSTLLCSAQGGACHLPLLFSQIFLLRKPTFNFQPRSSVPHFGAGFITYNLVQLPFFTQDQKISTPAHQQISTLKSSHIFLLRNTHHQIAKSLNHQIKCSPIFLLNYTHHQTTESSNHQIKSSHIFLLKNNN